MKDLDVFLSKLAFASCVMICELYYVTLSSFKIVMKSVLQEILAIYPLLLLEEI